MPFAPAFIAAGSDEPLKFVTGALFTRDDMALDQSLHLCARPFAARPVGTFRILADLPELRRIDPVEAVVLRPDRERIPVADLDLIAAHGLGRAFARKAETFRIKPQRAEQEERCHDANAAEEAADHWSTPTSPFPLMVRRD